MAELKVLKKKIIVVSLFLILFLLGIFVFFLQKKKTTVSGERFKLIAIRPDLTPNYLYTSGLRITLTFSQPLNVENFYYALSPSVQIAPQVASEGRQIILKPTGPWPEGNFTLTISKKTTSLKREKIDKDYFYQFRVGFVSEGGP